MLILTHLSLCVCECGHATKTEVQHLPSVCAWFPSLIEQQGGKTHFLSDTEEQSPEHKEGLTFCQEFDFSEEDCALNKSVIKRKKKKSPYSGLWGQQSRTGCNSKGFLVRSLGRWCFPFFFRNLMNCAGPDFVLVHQALSYFLSEILFHGEHFASLFRWMWDKLCKLGPN